MRPALQRLLVIGDDFSPWEAIVEAESIEDAIAKAERMYLADGVGYADIYPTGASAIEWRAVRMLCE